MLLSSGRLQSWRERGQGFPLVLLHAMAEPSPWLVRLPALVSGLLATAVAWRLGKKALGNTSALILAVLLAILSSLKNRPLPGKWVAFGEVGLAGEVRPAPRGQERLREAAKLGFTQAIIPAANKPRQKIEGIEIIAVERVADALAQFRGR